MKPERSTRIVPSATALLLRQMVASTGQHMTVEKNLATRADMVLQKARAYKLDVPVLGAAPLFDQVRLVTRTRPNWAIYNLSHDPLYKTGKFPLPARDLRRMKRLYSSGVQFDAMYIAHELPADFRPGQDSLELSLFDPAPPAGAIRLAEQLGHAAEGLLSRCLALVGKPLTALAAAGANTTAALLRDPILMGVVTPPGMNPDPDVPAVWFLLAAWSW